MKTRSLLILVLCVGLLLMSGAVSAQKTDKPPAEKKKSMMMMEKAWHMGATSTVLSKMLDEAGELLKAGNLKASDQKALGSVLDRLADLIPQLYYPGTMKPVQIQEIKKRMDDLGAELEKLEEQAKAK
jgi:hypothetical protein